MLIFSGVGIGNYTKLHVGHWISRTAAGLGPAKSIAEASVGANAVAVLEGL